MLKWLVTGDWERHFECHPKRKEAKLKVKKGAENQSENQGEEEEEGRKVRTKRAGVDSRKERIKEVDVKEPHERGELGASRCK